MIITQEEREGRWRSRGGGFILTFGKEGKNLGGGGEPYATPTVPKGKKKNGSSGESHFVRGGCGVWFFKRLRLFWGGGRFFLGFCR